MVAGGRRTGRDAVQDLRGRAMRIVVYEWCCSGGLAGPDADVGGAASAGLHAEGRGMFTALLRDALRERRFEVTALVDASRPLVLPAGARPCAVPVGGEVGALAAAAAAADLALVVAPETAGVLGRRVAAARTAGAVVAAPDAAFITLAADKQATITALAAAGLPVPAGRVLAAGAAWPEAFVRPAVRKPLDGAGGAGFVTVPHGGPPPAAVPERTRIEARVEGVPVGVSCLCGPGAIVPLPPLRQRFGGADAARYLGGEPLADRVASGRATGARSPPWRGPPADRPAAGWESI